MFDELGDGRLIVLGEDADEVDSAGQVVDVEGVQLLSLSVVAHDLATAQVVDHNLLYRLGALYMEHARGGVGEYAELDLLGAFNAYVVVNVFHSQGAHAGEDDVVHPCAVATASGGIVFLIAELEGVGARGDGEGGL